MPLPEFQQYQYAFTGHIRDPQKRTRPAGVQARRMNVYNELLFNNLRGFLDACFPVSRELLGETKWTRLMREFFAVHRCQSPLFRQIPEEFVRWLATGGSALAVPEHLRHLVHYEWVELALDVSPREASAPGADPSGDLLAGRPAVNPVSMLLEYPCAVHRLGAAGHRRRAPPEHTIIFAFRDPSDAVRFIVLNPVSARLVALLEPGRLTGLGALRRIARELQHPDPAIVIEGGRAILEDLRAQGALLGARPPARKAAAG